jgi:hypothetical protein
MSNLLVDGVRYVMVIRDDNFLLKHVLDMSISSNKMYGWASS